MYSALLFCRSIAFRLHRSSARALYFSILSLVCSSAHATIWYLDAAAAPGGNGSLASPWNSTSAIALGSLKSGDTVYIQGGDYSKQELALLFGGSQTGLTFAINPTATKQAVFKAIQLYGADGLTVDGLLPGVRTATGPHYSNSIQMIKTVGLNTVGLAGPSHSILIRQSTGATIRGVECDQSAIQYGVNDGNTQQHGIAVNGTVYNLIVEYNYVHDTIGDGLNYIYSGQNATSFTNIITRYNYVYRVGDDTLQGGGNEEIYGNLLDQGGVPIYYGAHPDAIQINPFCSYVKIHENTMVDCGQQPFLENVEGEIYCYNNVILCLRTGAIATSPGQTHGPVITSADGRSGSGYTGPSFGNLIFANNLIYNCTSFSVFSGSWPSNSGNNVVITGNVMINCKQGAPLGALYFCENTSIYWDLPNVTWYDSGGNVASVPNPRYFGTSLNEDPGLINIAGLDFHPAAATSHVVGLSLNLSKYGITSDFDGSARPATGNWTAGPYQWTGQLLSGVVPLVPLPNNTVTPPPSLPPAPVITSQTSASGTSGTALAYQITATNSPTGYTASNLPTGVTVNTATGVISVATTAVAGTYSITIGAKNAGGSGTATLKLVLAAAAPVVVAPANAVVGVKVQ